MSTATNEQPTTLFDGERAEAFEARFVFHEVMAEDGSRISVSISYQA